jgi:hypothetical protein
MGGKTAPRVDHRTSPGPVNRVVIGRLVLPAQGAMGLATGLYDFLIALPGLAAANEHRSRAVTREFEREHPCPSTGGRARRMSRISERSRRPARMWRTGCGLEHAVANCRRRKGQGRLGKAGVPTLTNRN